MGRIECDLGCPGAFAVVAKEDLKTDVSGLRPVLDENLERLVESIREQVRDVARQVHRLINEDSLLDGSPKVKEWVQERLRY